jgi:hypothetical protein
MRIRKLLLALVLLLILTGYSAEGNISTNSRQGVAPISAEFRPEPTARKPASHLGFQLRFLEALVRSGISYTDPFGLLYFGQTKDLGAVFGMAVFPKDPRTGKRLVDRPVVPGEHQDYVPIDISNVTVNIGEPCIAFGSDPNCPKYGVWAIEVRVFLPSLPGRHVYPFFSNEFNLDGSSTSFSMKNMALRNFSGSTLSVGPNALPVQLLNVICHCMTPDLP